MELGGWPTMVARGGGRFKDVRLSRRDCREGEMEEEKVW